MAENDKEINLKEAFDGFNKSGNVPRGGFSKEQILNGTDKIRSLLRIIEAAKRDTIKRGAEIFDNFNVSIEFASLDSKPFDAAISAVGFTEIRDANNPFLDVPINLNYSQLAKYGDVEAYAIVSAFLYNTLLKKRDMAASGKDVVFEKTDNQVNKTDNFEQSIFEYIKKFLKLFCDGNENFKNMEYSACAKWVAKNLNQHGIEAQNVFENPNGKNLFAERFAKVSKLGYQQQATALEGVFSKEELGALQSKDETEIKAFCQKFADHFLQNSHIPSDSYEIEIVHKDGGDLGQYIDSGENGQRLVINITEIQKLDNNAELVMTLAHELTHMVDSSKNKGEEKMSRKGFGLAEHNLVGSVNENAPDFVKKMEKVYYDVNPHERSARQGELVALEFLMQMQSDEVLRKQIDASLKSFQDYQRKTLETLQSKVDNLIKQYDEQKNSFNYDANTMDYIETVMNDLKKMKEEGLLDITEDLKALEESEAIKNKYIENPKESELGE